MDKQIKECVKQLDLPEGQFCLFGGSSLAIRRIRPTDDIDIFVTSELFDNLKELGWECINSQSDFPFLRTRINGVEIEVFKNSGLSDKWKPDIVAYINNPEIVQGIPFMPLKELYHWKLDTARQKDLSDVKLIERYWANKGK